MEKIPKKFPITDIYDDAVKFVTECYKQLSSQMKLMPGIEKLIMHLHKHNIPLAVATGCTAYAYEERTKKFRYLLKPGNFLSHVVCSEEDPDVENYKPHPDVFLVCAKRFMKQPLSMRNVLVIEDMYSGIQGAITAGMTTLLVPSNDWLENNREECNYDLFSQHLDLFGLPPF